MSRAAGARLQAVLLALAVSASVLPSAAQEAERVSLGDGGSPELARKLRAELAYAGFSAVETGSGTAPASILVLSPERIELSVQGVADGAAFTQTLERAPGEGDSFALRAVEALRARLTDVGWKLPEHSASQLELAAPPEPAAAPPILDEQAATPVEATPAATEAAAPELGLWLGGGAMASWSPGGLAVAPHAALSLRAELGRSWGAMVLAQLPLLDLEIEADEGEARIAWTALSAAIDRRLPLSAPWFASLGLGAALFVVDAVGEAQPQFSGRHERLTSGAGFAALSIGRELNDWLRLRALAMAGAAAPRALLRFDGREVASLGRAVGSLGLQLELGWPVLEAASP